MTRYDVAQYAYFAVFLTIATLCYGWEIWQRTPWLLTQKRLTEYASKFLWRKVVPDDNKTSTASIQASASQRSSTIDSERCDQSDAAVVNTLEGGGLASTLAKTRNLIAKWLTPPLKWITVLPGILWLLSIVFALLQLYHNRLDTTLLLRSTPGWNTSVLCEELSRISNATDLCDNSLPTRVDADIGGEGIRVGLYIPVGLTLLASLWGSFNTTDSGIKEVGTTQLLSKHFTDIVDVHFINILAVALFYLNFNAAKAAATTPSFSGLTFPEVVIVCMCIDLTAAGLHMTTSGKESLAARWFIYVAAVMHSWAIAMMIAMLAHIRGNYIDLAPVSIIWWGRIHSHTGPSKGVWLYIATRCCIFAHGLWLDCRHTRNFHIIERQWSSLLASGDQDVEKQKGIESNFDYGTLRATSFSKWIEYLPSILIASTSMETLVKRQLKSRSDITEWGQSAALVIAIAGLLHWTFVIVNGKIGARQSFQQNTQRRSGTAGLPSTWLSDDTFQERGGSKRAIDYPRYASDWDPLRRISNEDLIKAAKEFHKGAIRHALEHGADKDYVEPGTCMTVLLYAVERDNLSFFKELVFGHNASKDAGLASALFFAAEKGATEILKYLLETDINALIPPDSLGRTALWYAAENNRVGAVEILLAKIDKLHFGVSKQEYQKTGGALSSGTSLYAACGGRIECKTLISTAKHPPHQTPLFVAAKHGFSGIVQRLLNSPAQLDSSPNVREIFEAAVKRKNVLALNCLLSCKPDTVRLDDDDSSLLHLAVDDRGLELDFLIVIFKFFPAKLEVRDRHGRTALFLAVELNMDFAIKALLKQNADPFAKDSSGRSPITVAIEQEPSDLKSTGWSLSRPTFFEYNDLFRYMFPQVVMHPAGNPYSKTLFMGLMELPFYELAWLSSRCFIHPLDFEEHRTCLLLYALNRPDETALVVLTQCHGSRWRSKLDDVGHWQQEMRGKIDPCWTEVSVFDKIQSHLNRMSETDRERLKGNIANGGKNPVKVWFDYKPTSTT